MNMQGVVLVQRIGVFETLNGERSSRNWEKQRHYRVVECNAGALAKSPDVATSLLVLRSSLHHRFDLGRHRIAPVLTIHDVAGILGILPGLGDSAIKCEVSILFSQSTTSVDTD